MLDSGAFDSAQVAYNLLNPSAAVRRPRWIPRAGLRTAHPPRDDAGMGTIGIRAIAGGALSGTTERNPIGMAEVAPIGSSDDYATDVERGHAFEALLAEAGAHDLVELALRFAITDGGPTTVLVGTSTLDQVEHAIAAVEKGPLSPAVLHRAGDLWQEMGRA